MLSLLHSHKGLNKMSIGVIGMGVIGTAFYEGMKHAFDVLTYDRYKPEASNILRDCDVGQLPPFKNVEDAIISMVAAVSGRPIFVSVPTPMFSDGKCNTEIVESVCSKINNASNIVHNCEHFKQIVVIRSTVSPGTTERLGSMFKCLNIVFNPEFLTEANAIEDFKNQNRIILGGRPEATTEVAKVYKVAFPCVPVHECSSVCAEMVKYVGNCFLATKVSFANEIYQICNKINANYDKVAELASLDPRLGTSHWKVPGPDGHFGFGLTCFPKDINALIALATEVGVDSVMLKAAWQKNLEVRPEKDWEQLKGRVVI